MFFGGKTKFISLLLKEIQKVLNTSNCLKEFTTVFKEINYISYVVKHKKQYVNIILRK